MMFAPNSLAPKPAQLTSLTTWSHEHIRAIFEAQTDAQALVAISTTFAHGAKVTFNGSPLSREGIDHLVLMVRKSSKQGEGKGVKVRWLQSVEVPADSSNREGSFGGFYVLEGMEKELPGMKPETFERHKSVAAKIEYQDDEPGVDGRRIVNLAFVAANVNV